MTNLTTEEMQRIVDGAPIVDCIYDESGRYFDRYGNLLTKDGVWSLSDDKPDNGRNLSDLRLILEQNATILAQQQEIEWLKESRSRYAKYFNAFCWFVEDYGVEPLHSDNSPRLLENQLHELVKEKLDERDALAAHVEWLMSKINEIDEHADPELVHRYDPIEATSEALCKIENICNEAENLKPQDSLAEVRARQARRSFREGVHYAKNSETVSFEDMKAAEEHANKIRNGG